MPETEGATLRERKQARTRAAITAAGIDLFERNGYDETTIAEIAAAADIGTRTFFSYFESKEALLFPGADSRVQGVITAIETRMPGESPADVLLRALSEVDSSDTDLLSPLAALRLKLQAVPAVRGRSLQIQQEAERAIAAPLLAAFPDELTRAKAAALVAAFVGAVPSALREVLAESNDAGREEIARRLQEAVAYAIKPT
jgi:AcrR family transcriptional regulator